MSLTLLRVLRARQPVTIAAAAIFAVALLFGGVLYVAERTLTDARGSGWLVLGIAYAMTERIPAEPMPEVLGRQWDDVLSATVAARGKHLSADPLFSRRSADSDMVRLHTTFREQFRAARVRYSSGMDAVASILWFGHVLSLLLAGGAMALLIFLRLVNRTGHTANNIPAALP